MEPYEDTMGMDADERLPDDIRETATAHPPGSSATAEAERESVEQHTVQASGS